MRTLVLDIETLPIQAYVWGMYKTGVLEVIRPQIICCLSAKWLGGEHVTLALPDFKGYKPGQENDYRLVQRLWQLLNEADCVIAHHGDSFDLPTVNARILYHGFNPPKPYRTIDTRKVARKVFRFGANSLDHLCSYLGLGGKLSHGGYDLWRRCMDGDDAAWATMRAYNKHDVVLLEKLYYKLQPWIPNHPNAGLYAAGVDRCPKCSSEHLQSRGVRHTATRSYRQFQCVDCGGWSKSTRSVSAISITNA